ncbi:MAG: alpha/beta hydrolase [Burkholderiaceae bacterium]
MSIHEPPIAREAITEANGMRLHHIEWGPLDAPVLVTLHGLRSYSQTFAGVAGALGDRWRVISLDQRGRGESSWDPQHRYETHTYADDIAAWVDALGLQRFHLLGHSMGGANAIVYAARAPERVISLTLEDMGPGASGGSAGGARIKAELARTPKRFGDWDEAARFWRSIRPGVTEEAIASRVRHSLREQAPGEIVWRHDQDGIAAARLANPPVDLWPHITRITCPMLLLRGADSDFVTADIADQMQARCPALERVDVPGAGHYVHDDAPQAFHAALIEFLERQRSKT